MVDECIKADLPEPEYREHFGGFEIVFFKDKFTVKYLKNLGLNERQIEIVFLTKKNKIISNKFIIEQLDVSRQTVTNDLSLLIEKNILERKGMGAGVVYELKID